jgi:outer membrane protein TolC
LAFLIGQPVGQITDPTDTPDTLHDQVNYVAKSDLRPDVKAAEYAWGVAKKQVTVSRSDLFPTVSLEGNGFVHKNDAPNDQSWATVLKVDVPIFEGTTTYGNIKGSNAQARISELELQQTQRLAVQDIRDSYSRAHAAILRVLALDNALKAAEKNYSLQKKDYEYNLVNNLDVLSAIRSLGDTRRNFLQALYEKKRYYWQLRAAVGEIGQENRSTTALRP